MKTINRKFQKGFSLGEVLLSLAVLTAGILPILGALLGALNTSLESRETVIGTGLAQEGVELVVNVKDNGLLSPANDAFAAFNNGNQTCRIDINSPVLDDPATQQIECGSGMGGGTPFYFDLSILPPNYLYGHDNQEAKFKRKIFINYNPGQRSASVTSAVYWGAYDPSHSTVDADCTALNDCAQARTMLRPWK